MGFTLQSSQSLLCGCNRLLPGICFQKFGQGGGQIVTKLRTLPGLKRGSGCTQNFLEYPPTTSTAPGEVDDVGRKPELSPLLRVPTGL